MERNEYGYKKEKEILLFVLVVVGLAVAGFVFAQTFNTPTVDDVSTPFDVGIGTDVGASAIGVANVSANQSEVEGCPGCPEWWHWSREDWEKFQWYANETEIIWTYNKTTGEKIRGRVMVAGEPLWKGAEHTDFRASKSPVEYFTIYQRKGICADVAPVVYRLFKAKGETVKGVGGKDINDGCGHAWVEWRDSEGREWAINFNDVIPVEQQHKKYRPDK